MHLNELGFSIRVARLLEREGILTVEELLKRKGELGSTGRGFGLKAMGEIGEKLDKLAGLERRDIINKGWRRPHPKREEGIELFRQNPQIKISQVMEQLGLDRYHMVEKWRRIARGQLLKGVGTGKGRHRPPAKMQELKSRIDALVSKEPYLGYREVARKLGIPASSPNRLLIQRRLEEVAKKTSYSLDEITEAVITAFEQAKRIPALEDTIKHSTESILVLMEKVETLEREKGLLEEDAKRYREYAQRLKLAFQQGENVF